MAQKEIIHFPGPFLFALCCVTVLGRLRSPPALASHSAVDLASYFTGNMEITRKGLPRAWPPALGLRHSARSPVTADELPVLRRPPGALALLPPLFPSLHPSLCSGVAPRTGLPQLKLHASPRASSLFSSVALLTAWCPVCFASLRCLLPLFMYTPYGQESLFCLLH